MGQQLDAEQVGDNKLQWIFLTLAVLLLVLGIATLYLAF
jgi:flagellar basal body-associated protein FliL